MIAGSQLAINANNELKESWTSANKDTRQYRDGQYTVTEYVSLSFFFRMTRCILFDNENLKSLMCSIIQTLVRQAHLFELV